MLVSEKLVSNLGRTHARLRETRLSRLNHVSAKLVSGMSRTSVAAAEPEHFDRSHLEGPENDEKDRYSLSSFQH